MYMLCEETYSRQMQEIVEPYNRAHREEILLPVEEGKNLYVRKYTAEEARGVVVISHGFSESSKKHTEGIYYFLQSGFHVVIADHCGHGRSYRLVTDKSLVHVDSWERYVRDLETVANKAKEWFPDLPMYLYGHSMGGGIGAALLERNPKLFDRAILSSPMIEMNLGSPAMYTMSKMLADAKTLTGKGEQYCPGQHPFDGKETLEESSASSRARFEWYQKIRALKPEYQTCSASCSWAREAMRMSKYVQKHAGDIRTRVLLLQAGKDSLVSLPAQDRFAESSDYVKIVRFPEAKHEIFNCSDATVEEYWKQVTGFLWV